VLFISFITDTEQLFKRLEEANMKVKTTKCRIAAKETMFLGFKISEEGVQMKEDRVESVKKYPRPRNQRKLKTFLGLSSYYRQFIRGFAESAAEEEH
jgi:hypothetical protein